MPKNKSIPMIGRRIVEARINAGFATQKDLATALGVSVGLIGQWEANVKVPGRLNLVRIAQTCGSSIEELLGHPTTVDALMRISDKDEIKLVLMYRQLVPLGKKNLLDLLEHGLIRRGNALQKETHPA